MTPNGGDLYAAHFLGPAGAAKLMEAMRSSPNGNAVNLFPEAAASNRSIFYRQGRPATVAEVYANLQSTAGGSTPVLPDAKPAAPAMGAKDMALAARMDRLKQDQGLLSLLLSQGEGSQFGGAFSEAVKN